MVVQAVANRCDRCFEDHIRHSLQQLAAVLQQGGVRLALESLDLGLEQARFFGNGEGSISRRTLCSSRSTTR
jgi:hypothetical protein